MANALFNSTGRFSQIAQVGKWVNALVNTGAVKRVVDAKPIWAQLKITERCNLNCGYCTEHKNNGNHVPVETVFKWIQHCHDLGVKHVEFIGGEPLMHPDLFAMLSRAKELKMKTGLTTNGFLMDREKAARLLDLGIKRLQLSIDCVKPNSVTKKAFNLLKPQLEFLRAMDIWVHVNSVIAEETIGEAYELAKLLFELKIPVAFSPVHDKGLLVVDSSSESIVKFLKWLTVSKKNGAPVNMPQFLIDYYIDTMQGNKVNWSCEGGCKAFYVDTDGYFRVCSHTESDLKFMDVDNTVLKHNHARCKGCEKECGVSCMILSSLPFNRLDYIVHSDVLPGFRMVKSTACKLKECTA